MTIELEWKRKGRNFLVPTKESLVAERAKEFGPKTLLSLQ